MSKQLEETKRDLIQELNNRVQDKILEQNNADLLRELINNADTINKAISIAELGTSYQRTGFHFDIRLEKFGNTIKYLKKNNKLSFDQGGISNTLIIGDNYDALQNLLIQYEGKIDVIYIDPPYGKDKMGKFAETNYNNAITRDNLLSSLYPRLKLAKKLLSDDGFIFCSIDDKNYAYVKCLFDDIFSEECFINSFVWKKNSSGKTEKDKFTTNTEYVLFYAKEKNYTLKDVYKPLSEATVKLYSKNDNDGRGFYRLYPLQKPGSPGPETTYDYIDNKGKVWKCPEKGWRINKNKMKDLENDNRLCLENSTLSEKAYWNERANSGKRIDTLWDDLQEGSAASTYLDTKILEGHLFDNPKPIDLIKRCIGIHPNMSGNILDFYSGSGTTGQAVLELNKEDGGNRNFILCTNNEITDDNPNGIAIDVTTKRLKRVMTGSCYDGNSNFPWIKDNEPLGNSLNVYDIAEVANFESAEGKTPFDAIDETAYGLSKFENINDKIAWVCENFDGTQKYLEDK